MNRIGVVGMSWRHRHANLLGDLTIPREARETRVPALAAEIGTPEIVYLATCNRVEVAFVADDRTPLSVYRRRVFAALRGHEPNPGEAEQIFRLWHGEGAVEHIFVVSAGLDSARIGEGEVAQQLQEAVEYSRSAGLVGSQLGPVFDEAARVTKRLRTATEGRIGQVSLADIVIRHVEERLEQTPGAVALIGVSPMTERCGRALRDHGIPVVVVNRTVERAAALAEELGGVHRQLDAFRAAPDPVEAVITATGGTDPVMSRADLERLAARTRSGLAPLIVDMGVPPNVTPEDAAAADVPRLGMAEIADAAAEDRGRMLMEFADARAIVDDALTDLRRKTAERLVGPIIAALRRRYDHTAREGVERLFAKHLPNLSESERDAVRRWAETLSRRFAHIPSVGLRDLAFMAGPAAVEAFFASTAPELTAALHRAAEEAGLDSASDLEAGS